MEALSTSNEQDTVMSDLNQTTNRSHELPASDTSDKAARPAFCKLENDLGAPASAAAPIDLAGIASRYKIERAKAMDWAVNDMKFLVYDDTDSKLHGYDSDDEDGMLAFAQESSLNHEDDVEELPIASSSHQQHTQGKTCRVCSVYPEFPHAWKARKFRLVKPTLDHSEKEGHAVDLCQHYVAVSYCWPPRDEKPAPRQYQVRDLDNTVRSNRALDDVLDRAVDFANTSGLRMIWIDQECLPQPSDDSPKADWDEQGLGIQSMDIVYNRAKVTAGLLDVHIDTQAQLNAVEALMYFERERVRSMVDHEFCYHILDILYRTSLDRWYTRAWVVQESLCAGSKFVLTFRRGTGLSFPFKFRAGYQAESESRPYHSLDDNPQGLSSNIVCVPLESFWDMIDAMNSLLGRDFVSLGTQLVRYGGTQSYAMPDARVAIQAADSLHPRFIKGNTAQHIIMIYCRGHYGKRPTINAAAAITLLKRRQCYHDTDRLAIVANMCDYDFRLDTRAVGRSCTSLSQAMLALALNNGDTSLLVPETYKPLDEISVNLAQSEHSNGSVLFAEFPVRAAGIDHCSARNFMNFRLQSSRPGYATPAGVQLPAYIWSVDCYADFTPIRSRWAKQWESIKCWSISATRLKGESPGQFRARQQAIAKRFSEPGVDNLARLEFEVSGCIPKDSVIWRGIDNTDVQVRRFINARRVMGHNEMRNIVTRVLFDILRYAPSSLESAQHGRALADAMWHSIRTDQALGSKNELPDHVDEAFFLHNDILQRPSATLQLEEERDGGSFAQLWFVDRIMENGGLWCGHYTKSWKAMSKSTDQPSNTEPSVTEPHFGASTLVRSPEQGKGKAPAPSGPDMSKKSIVNRQISYQLLARLVISSYTLTPRESSTAKLKQ